MGHRGSDRVGDLPECDEGEEDRGSSENEPSEPDGMAKNRGHGSFLSAVMASSFWRLAVKAGRAGATAQDVGGEQESEAECGGRRACGAVPAQAVRQQGGDEHEGEPGIGPLAQDPGARRQEGHDPEELRQPEQPCEVEGVSKVTEGLDHRCGREQEGDARDRHHGREQSGRDPAGDPDPLRGLSASIGEPGLER